MVALLDYRKVEDLVALMDASSAFWKVDDWVELMDASVAY
jgi:hypothetical protein